jgi:hypothetical protein
MILKLMLFLKYFFIVGIAFNFLSQSNAKVIYEPYQNTQEVTVRIEDEITHKDLIDFKSALKQLDDSKKTLHMNSVVLNSFGGNGAAAKEIGRLIRERKLNTYLAKDKSCSSACVHVLIGGVQRYAFGSVGVHRATYMGESDGDEYLQKNIEEATKSNEQHVKVMGVSMLLADAMDTTPSWTIRQLTELEKKQWQVFGFDRLSEELYFNQVSRERYISRREFIDIFKSNYEDCLNQAREFKETVFECSKTKKHKEPSYYTQFLKFLVRKIDFYLGSEIDKLSHHDQVDSLRKNIRYGDLYERYTTITEVTDTKPKSSEKSLDAQLVQRMEDVNKWWVENNKLSVLVLNPINSDLKEVVFELSSTDCKTENGQKHLLSMPLFANLEANNTAVYSGQLPFDYEKVIGKGTRCGVIKDASY